MSKVIPVLALAVALALSGCGKVETTPPGASDAKAANDDTGGSLAGISGRRRASRSRPS